MEKSCIRDKYERVKQFYPATLILFPAGDFYETYCKDAEVLSKFAGLRLLDRNDYKLCGFPKHQYDEIRKKITTAIESVAIIDDNMARNFIKKSKEMENMENKKVIKEKAFKHIEKSSSDYYLLNKEAGALEQVSIQSIIFNLSTGKITYNIKHRDSVRQIVAKEDFESKFTLKLYKSDYDYVTQNPIQVNQTFNSNYLKWKMKSSFHVSYVNDDSVLIGYAVKNGEAVEVNALDYFDEVEMTWSENGAVQYTPKYINGEPDFDHIYQYNDDALRFESVKVANNDGTYTQTDAPMSMLTLNEEQQKVLDNFLAAKKALKEAGVGLLFGRDDWDLYAVNTNNFERIDSDEPCNSFSEYLQDGYLLIDRLPQKMSIGFDIVGHFDNDCVSAICKIKK